MTFFQFLTVCVLGTFLGIMVFVTIIAYSRQSGATGQNMAQIQKQRYHAAEKRG